MRALSLILVISAALSLAACGNKGQLVLPTQQPAPAKKTDPEPAKTQPADASASGHPTTKPDAQ
jgi:predicted small lipoprotein YifL